MLRNRNGSLAAERNPLQLSCSQHVVPLCCSSSAATAQLRGRRQIKKKINVQWTLRSYSLLCLSMDKEVDELGNGLEDLGIEIDVDFVSYVESRETLKRI